MSREPVMVLFRNWLVSLRVLSFEIPAALLLKACFRPTTKFLFMGSHCLFEGENPG
jgi:hypothetical protein